jgi:hypothetical protein
MFLALGNSVNCQGARSIAEGSPGACHRAHARDPLRATGLRPAHLKGRAFRPLQAGSLARQLDRRPPQQETASPDPDGRRKLEHR